MGSRLTGPWACSEPVALTQGFFGQISRTRLGGSTDAARKESETHGTITIGLAPCTAHRSQCGCARRVDYAVGTGRVRRGSHDNNPSHCNGTLTFERNIPDATGLSLQRARQLEERPPTTPSTSTGSTTTTTCTTLTTSMVVVAHRGAVPPPPITSCSVTAVSRSRSSPTTRATAGQDASWLTSETLRDTEPGR